MKSLLRNVLTRYQFCIPESMGDIPARSSLGCHVDCKTTHGYKTGECVNEVTPVATFPGQLFVGFYCGCES